MTRTRFYVGLTTRDGKPVSPAIQDQVAALVADCYGGGCTVYGAVGYWRGVREGSMVIEVLTDDHVQRDREYRVPKIASRLARLASQSVVLWTQEEVNGGFEA